MNKQPSTAYSVLFRNEDGSLRGTIPGSTPECAIRAANALEGQEVFGFATIRVEAEPISGMRFVLREVGPKAEPVALAQQPTPQVDAQFNTEAFEAALSDYIDGYEFVGEDDSGREGSYTPNERERRLIEDAVRGWEPPAAAPQVSGGENREALAAAAKSLRTIADLAGGTAHLMDVSDIRGYANSRASVAEAELAAADQDLRRG